MQVTAHVQFTASIQLRIIQALVDSVAYTDVTIGSYTNAACIALSGNKKECLHILASAVCDLKCMEDYTEIVTALFAYSQDNLEQNNVAIYWPWLQFVANAMDVDDWNTVNKLK